MICVNIHELWQFPQIVTIYMNCDNFDEMWQKLEICFEMLLADSEFGAFTVNYCDDTVEWLKWNEWLVIRYWLWLD